MIKSVCFRKLIYYDFQSLTKYELLKRLPCFYPTVIRSLCSSNVPTHNRNDFSQNEGNIRHHWCRFGDILNHLDISHNVKNLKVSDYISQCTKNHSQWNPTFNSLAQAGNVSMILELFEYMRKNNIPILHEYKKYLLEGCLVIKDSNTAYNFLQNEPILKLNNNLFKVALLCCASSGDFHHAHKIYQLMKDNFIPAFIGPWNAIIDAYATAGNTSGALQAIKDMELYDKISPELSTFNRLLKVCCVAKNYELARSIFSDMIKRGLQPDESTWATLVNVAVSSGDIRTARNIILEMRQSENKVSYIRSYNYLLMALSDLENINEFESVFEELLLVGCTPNFYTYNVAITAYAKRNDKQKIRELLSQMLAADIKITYQCWRVASAPFTRSDDAEGLLGMMHLIRESQSSTTPTVYMWRDVIAAYGKMRKFTEAYQILQKMKVLDNLTPDFSCWHRLVRISVDEGGWEKGYTQLQNMRRNGMKPIVSTWQYILKDCATWSSLSSITTLLVNMRVEDNLLPNRKGWEELISIICTRRFGENPSKPEYYYQIETEIMSQLLTQLPSTSRDALVQEIIQIYANDLHRLSSSFDFLTIFANSGKVGTLTNWNRILSQCAVDGESELCNKALEEMKRMDIRPDPASWLAIATCYKNTGKYKAGIKVIETALSNISSIRSADSTFTVPVQSTTSSVHFSNELEATVSFTDTTSTVDLYNLMIELQAMDGQWKRCMETLSTMIASTSTGSSNIDIISTPNEKTFSLVKDTCIANKKLKEAIQVTKLMLLTRGATISSSNSGLKELISFCQPLIIALLHDKDYLSVEDLLKVLFDLKGMVSMIPLISIYIKYRATTGRGSDALDVVEKYTAQLIGDVNPINNNNNHKINNLTIHFPAVDVLWKSLFEGYSESSSTSGYSSHAADNALWALERRRKSVNNFRGGNRTQEAVIWGLVVRTLCKADRLQEASHALEDMYVLDGALPTVDMWTLLLQKLSEKGYHEDCLLNLDNIRKRGYQPLLEHWHAVIISALQRNLVEAAWSSLNQMKEIDNLHPTIDTFLILIKYFAARNNEEKMIQLLTVMKQHKIAVDQIIVNEIKNMKRFDIIIEESMK